MDNASKISLRERIRLNLLSSMERANINQVQLAEKLGISKGTVNNWARGNNSPDVDMVPKICKVLGISILDLYSPTRLEPQEDKKSPPLYSSEAEEQLIALHRKLNSEGQEKLLDYADDLVSSGKYIKSNPDKLGKAKNA